MAKMNHRALTLLALTALVAAAAVVEGAITCGQVTSSLGPCLGYLQTGGMGLPSSTCCGGITALKNAARTTADRQAICGCLKQLAAGVPPNILGAAAGIPSKCQVTLPYRIDPSIDCSTVQ